MTPVRDTAEEIGLPFLLLFDSNRMTESFNREASSYDTPSYCPLSFHFWVHDNQGPLKWALQKLDGMEEKFSLSLRKQWWVEKALKPLLLRELPL